MTRLTPVAWKAQPRDRIALGLIGLGRIGRVHARALREPGQVAFELVAAAEVAPPSTEHEGVTVYRDHRELLARPDIEAVSIATPPDTHFSLALDALNAGKHVLVEKPPTLNLDQSRELVRLAAATPATIFMAFHARYHSAVEVARQELANREVQEVLILFREHVSTYHSPDSWIFDPQVAGGGVLMDSGINAMSIVTRVLPDVREFHVTSARLDQLPGFQVETAARVNFSFEPVGRGCLDMDWMHDGPEVRQVTFRVSTNEYTVDILTDSLIKDGSVLFCEMDTSEYSYVYRDFADHIIRGVSSQSTLELSLILDAYRSVQLSNEPA